jgi:hypothetical protein
MRRSRVQFPPRAPKAALLKIVDRAVAKIMNKNFSLLLFGGIVLTLQKYFLKTLIWLKRSRFGHKLVVVTTVTVQTLNWPRIGFASPSPSFIKRSCIKRNCYPNATWVETGTYLGETTSFMSKLGTKVFSIEPEPELFLNAKIRLSKHINVEILNGTSEDVLPNLLPNINGDVNFWLDGHYSMGITFKGERDTPIIQELEAIPKTFHILIKFVFLSTMFVVSTRKSRITPTTQP